MEKLHILSNEDGWHMPSVEELVEAFKIFLEVKYQSHHKKYLDRLASDPEAARAEAVLFSVLRWARLDPVISEDVSSGGIDFLCHKDGKDCPAFFLEVTSLGADAAAGASGIPEAIPDASSAGWYKTIAKQLHRIVCNKTPQLSARGLPCVLAITTEHYSGEALLGIQAAESLLIGDTKISMPVGEAEAKISIITELKESAFFRPKKESGEIEACRKGIAAILLVQIYSKECRIVGLLHPDPTHSFSINLLSSIPFLRLRNWPPKDNRLSAEWVIASPEAAQFYYQSVQLTDEDLKMDSILTAPKGIQIDYQP